MKAVAFRKRACVDETDSLYDTEIERPRPGPRDLLVAIRAVSVNPVDTKIRAGLVPVPDAVSTLGWDAAGMVEAVGSAVTLFRPGQAVYYAGSFDRAGTNAQFHLVDERIVGRKPETLSFAQAAALPLTALTAWQVLFDRLGVAPGKPAQAGSLLVVGGAGGVGSMLIQLARRLTGLTVIATASRPQGRDRCLALGAHCAIDHTQALPQQVAALAAPPVTHVAALSHTGRHLPALAALIAPQGRIAVIDDHDFLDATPLKAKSVSLHWEMVFTRPLYGTPDMIAQHRILNEVAALVDAGLLRPSLGRTLHPIDAANLRLAHRLVERGEATGKVVVAALDPHGETQAHALGSLQEKQP
ncbi:zinc-binding alcohol dehydrogenase family protein [Cupriavidus basilensis]|uniref:Zinc-type alcohol dehydrogenase-like protein n=1 Tax=Cupriavidus basilensis TaxID=68895 RepID=A0ABT6AZ65_9BURK|nr:zinc-binding alcohol dehydrogenase family protein [Cupriavidus basilensis]MDF3837905.1 zinc-binding alcohol dehydrogenase family protein [Cupriavidus basilensis]